MKKFLLFVSVLFILLSISSVGAGLFGPETAECKQFSIEIPEGYGKSDGYMNNNENFFYLASSWNDKDNITDRTLYISEVSSFDDFNRSKTEKIIENYTDGDIKAEKCNDSNGTVSLNNGTLIKGSNYTHIEFTKDGHNYIIENQFKGKYQDIDLKKDVDLVKKIKDTLKHK